MTNEIETIMALADEYAKAWHANQTSRLIAAYDNGDHRKALQSALEAALKPPEPVAKYLGECADGSLVQLYDEMKKGAELYVKPPVQTPPIDAALKPGEPVACVTVSHYKGLENRDFDYWGELPDGTHHLYTTTQAQTPLRLTDQEIESVNFVSLHQSDWDEFGVYQPSVTQFARAIEEKVRKQFGVKE